MSAERVIEWLLPRRPAAGRGADAREDGVVQAGDRTLVFEIKPEVAAGPEDQVARFQQLAHAHGYGPVSVISLGDPRQVNWALRRRPVLARVRPIRPRRGRFTRGRAAARVRRTARSRSSADPPEPEPDHESRTPVAGLPASDCGARDSRGATAAAPIAMVDLAVAFERCEPPPEQEDAGGADPAVGATTVGALVLSERPLLVVTPTSEERRR